MSLVGKIFTLKFGWQFNRNPEKKALKLLNNYKIVNLNVVLEVLTGKYLFGNQMNTGRGPEEMSRLVIYRVWLWINPDDIFFCWVNKVTRRNVLLRTQAGDLLSFMISK